jgi:hypothetical protein
MNILNSPVKYRKPDVAVPTEPHWKYSLNEGIQITDIVLYSLLLIYVLHNTYKYLWIKRRYKVLTHALFYAFAIMLAVGRIYQHACSFNWLSTYKLRFLNNMCDGFSVCIGISQVVVVAELVFAMELFKTEMGEQESTELL